MARNALGIVTRMGHDLGHGCEAIEPGPVGKRPVFSSISSEKKPGKTELFIRLKTANVCYLVFICGDLADNLTILYIV